MSGLKEEGKVVVPPLGLKITVKALASTIAPGLVVAVQPVAPLLAVPVAVKVTVWEVAGDV
jgi:hypothetical protein